MLFRSYAVFRDEKTPKPFIEPGIPEQRPDMIYLDAMGFGMGMCCLQVTFQACNIAEARALYDNLAPLCPIMVNKEGHLGHKVLEALINVVYI